MLFRNWIVRNIEFAFYAWLSSLSVREIQILNLKALHISKLGLQSIFQQNDLDIVIKMINLLCFALVNLVRMRPDDFYENDY